MRDVERLKDKVELSLDSRQIFFLFFGGAVAACLVFVLGVMIGRRLEGRERVGDRAATTAAVDPLQALDELGGDEAAAEAAPKTEAAAATATTPAKAETAKPPVKTTEAPKPVEPAKVEAPKPTAVEPVKPEAPKEAVAPPKAEKSETETKPTDATSKKARYTLQLSSFQAKAEAEAFAAKVSKGGYKPYITESDVPGKGLFYRVRIGGYGSQDEALEAKNAFEGAMGIIAYVTKL